MYESFCLYIFLVYLAVGHIVRMSVIISFSMNVSLNLNRPVYISVRPSSRLCVLISANIPSVCFSVYIVCLVGKYVFLFILYVWLVSWSLLFKVAYKYKVGIPGIQENIVDNFHLDRRKHC